MLKKIGKDESSLVSDVHQEKKNIGAILAEDESFVFLFCRWGHDRVMKSPHTSLLPRLHKA